MRAQLELSNEVATELAGEVSLAVTSTGLARFVYDSDIAVHEFENSATTLAAAAAPTLADATFSDIVRSQLMDRGSATLPTVGSSPSSGAPTGVATPGAAETTSTVTIPRFGPSAP